MFKSFLVGTLVIGMVAGFMPVVANAATVAAPVFSPSYSSLTTKTKISLSSSTSGASIYYTYSRGSTPSNPTTSSYRYNSTYGVDLQQGDVRFYVGMYYVKAVAYYNGSYSSIVSSSFNVTNKDQSSRNTLSAKYISVNKDDCWLANKKVCTSLVGMTSGTLNEIGYFAQGCNTWLGGSYTNRCGVLVTGGTEAGHSGSGTCSHLGGHKFDMSLATSATNFIKTSGQFTYLGIRSDGAPMYKWKSGGAVYAQESTHWDVLVGC